MRVRDLTLSHQGTVVLQALELTIPEEGLTFLSGPSGVGKTTLLRVLAGLLEPDAGTVERSGRPVMLFQEDRLFPRCPAQRQVEAVLPRERRGEARRLLELVELAEDGDKLPGELSGGMARRLALARCLAAGEALDARWYLLDEPFAGVDLDRAGRILKRLRALDRPMLLTGHSPELAGWCDRTIQI